MTRLFRSKSCTLARLATNSMQIQQQQQAYEDEEDEEEEEGYYGYATKDEDNPVTTPFISPERRQQRKLGLKMMGQNRIEQHQQESNSSNNQFPILEFLMAALRKSLVTCSVDRDDVVSNMDIGWPTDVRHVSHVTFDRFNGFLGLPTELELDVPRKVPSASVSVFGVSAQSMQCSYDHRGNSVPTILLMMQNRLYSEGGLQAEGIFRINAENSQEESVRSQLNKGVVPPGIDVHCLAGLIKAWFRELPTGVLDSLSPEQVMHCNTEEECSQLMKSLPPTEAALLDWAINLMADVVEHETHNKMNARNIAMVFAPNMTQMADPLTALIHAVQVMNFLKTLITKTLREREESTATSQLLSLCGDSPFNNGDAYKSTPNRATSYRQASEAPGTANLLRSITLERLESDNEEKFWSFRSKSDDVKADDTVLTRNSTPMHKRQTLENSFKDEYINDEVEGAVDWLNLRKGVRKLCQHPVFQLSKPVKKSSGVGVVNTGARGGEAWT